MTDFFADLEREIRAAHPRRSRPVVPVKPIAAAAAVAVTVVAFVMALGALSPVFESEVATQPTPDPQPTPVSILDCEGRVVDGRIPDEVVDRFAILRGDSAPVELRGEQFPDLAAEVYRQSLRKVEGPAGRSFVFAIVRLADADCNPSDLGVCLVSARSDFCTVLEEEPLLGYVVDRIPDGRGVVAIVGDDDIPRVAVSSDRKGVLGEFELEASTGFQLIPDGDMDVDVTPATRVGGEEAIPLDCSIEPAMSGLKERLAIFRRSPGGVPPGFRVELPRGWHRMFLKEMRAVGEHFVFPAHNAACDTGVCIVAADDPTAACQSLEEGAILVSLVRREGDRARVAGLAHDGLSTVDVTSAGTTRAIPVRDNLFTFVAPAAEFVVEPGS
jgi:hypothetical protein